MIPISRSDHIPFPDKKYNIIYADPPWSYNDKASAGQRGSCYKYDVQDQGYLKNLPVQEIAAADSVLFLWVTMPMIPEGVQLLEHWGFKYKTVAFTWVKKNKITDSWFWGMGNWTRANPEVCLLGVKGNIRRTAKDVHSVVDSRIQFHSQKPDEVRNRIVRLMGDLPRIELFARTREPGWDCWGYEVSSSQTDIESGEQRNENP